MPTKYNVQIIVEFPKEHESRDRAEESAERVTEFLSGKYPAAHIETHIWEG